MASNDGGGGRGRRRRGRRREGAAEVVFVEEDEAVAEAAPVVLGYDRITIDMSDAGVLGKGSNGEVRKGTVDGQPAVFKVWFAGASPVLFYTFLGSLIHSSAYIVM